MYRINVRQVSFHSLLILSGISIFVVETSAPGARSLADIPNPTIDPVGCGRIALSYICDPDAIISRQDAFLLDEQLKDIQTSTTCPCSADHLCRASRHGYIIGIALVKRIKLSVSVVQGGSDAESPNDEHALKMKSLIDEAKQLSYDLLLKWNMGHCRDGILVLYSLQDNILYTAVDSAAAGKLTDDVIGEISSNVRMDLIRNTSVGLEKLLSSFKSVFQGTYERTSHWDSYVDALPVLSSSFHPSSSVLWVLVLSLAALWVVQHLTKPACNICSLTIRNRRC